MQKPPNKTPEPRKRTWRKTSWSDASGNNCVELLVVQSKEEADRD